jgi:hypothetical protein
LLVRYRKEAPSRGTDEYWQVFRFRNQKLGLFDAFATLPQASGLMTGTPFGGTAIGAIAAPGFAAARGDNVEIRVWTGNFEVVVPARVDWQQGRIWPGQQCFQSPGMVEVGCEMRVEATRKRVDADLIPVRMFVEAIENPGNARHVVLKRDSKVEFIAAKAIAKWTISDDMFQIGLSDIWLKVLIDDNEDKMGWIHSEDDFAAVGLPRGNAP